MNSLMLVKNADNEKYDVWTLADAAEYLSQQEKKMKKYKRSARRIMKSCCEKGCAGGVKWRFYNDEEEELALGYNRRRKK